MRPGRFVSAITMAAFLASCGGGGSGGGLIGGGGGGGGGTPPPTGSDCSLSARQDWTLEQLQNYYLFPSLLDTSVNQGAYSTVQDYIDALVAPARAQNFDRGFTYITSIEAEEEASSGSTAGYGVRLSLDASNRLIILEAFEAGPAFGAGIDRGTEIVAIGTTSSNLRTVADILATEGTAGLNSALGPTEAGVTRFLEISDAAGTRVVEVTKAEYTLDPISDRYGAQILNDGGKQVGYINLRTFFNRTTLEQQLRDAFGQFKAQGVTEIIVDVRYNGGGFLFTAETMNNLMGDDLAGQTQFFINYSPNRASENQQANFSREANGIATTKIAYIGFGGTASASELVMSAFIPYRGNNLALIGANTAGKPAGQEAYDRAECDDRLRVLAFELENADRNGGYFNGIAPLMPNTCRATDDATAQMGDPNEDSTRMALDWLAGRGTCTPVAGTPGVQGAQSVQDRKQLLQPEFSKRSAIQHRVPGLY